MMQSLVSWFLAKFLKLLPINVGYKAKFTIGELTAFPTPNPLVGFKGTTAKEKGGNADWPHFSNPHMPLFVLFSRMVRSRFSVLGCWILLKVFPLQNQVEESFSVMVYCMYSQHVTFSQSHTILSCVQKLTRELANFVCRTLSNFSLISLF